MVYSLSRLARSVKDTIMISERLEKAGANLASLTERLDTSSAIGKMVFRLLSTLNEFEKDQISERTVNALGFLRRTNRRISVRIPFGYDLAEDGMTLTLNRSEQVILEQMVGWRADGKSFAVIANTLSGDGVRTKEGKNWFASTVRGILLRTKKLAA